MLSEVVVVEPVVVEAVVVRDFRCDFHCVELVELVVVLKRLYRCWGYSFLAFLERPVDCVRLGCSYLGRNSVNTS